jgi:hypothetical protein
MSLREFLINMKRSDKRMETIFDAEEPIGKPTDLVMPRRRWFRRRPPAPGSLEAQVLEASRWKQ